jgi:signal transduction histidine kinase
MEERVLILSSLKRDADLAKAILNRNQIAVKRCTNVLELCLEIKSGAGAVLLAAETMDRHGISALTRTLAEQPAWSHLPFVILLKPGELSDASHHSLSLLEPIKNATLLERPVRLITLVGILRSALADRARQYEMRRLVLDLEKSNSALSQFASIASHDLQEPLRTIATYIQIFERENNGKLDGKAKELLDFARDGACRMHTLVSDLLAYSMVGADELNLSEINSESLFNQALSSIQGAIKDSGAKITKRGSFPRITGDEMKLTRLFQNLLSNAIKFRRASTAPEIEIIGKQTDDDVVFSIRDNGIGIARNDIPKVFRIFQRLNSRSEYPGSGIGLATCLKIAERHQGSISVDSVPGEGTTFSVNLPRNRADARSQPTVLAG